MQLLDVLTLDGWLLDYFTGLALNCDMVVSNGGAGPAYRAKDLTRAFEPCLIPNDMLPVLNKMTTVLRMPGSGWQARAYGSSTFADGPTVSVAVCRALVVGEFGVNVPHPAPVAVPADCEDLFA